MERFRKLIAACAAKGFSDLHITGGQPMVCRHNDQVTFQKEHHYTPGEVDSLVGQLLNDRQRRMLKTRWSVDFGITMDKVRLRINVFATTRGLSMSIRFLPGQVPDIEKLNLHPSIMDLAKAHSGLVLICGATGSGKTTTIASMINEINKRRQDHIITLENPIEYRYQNRASFIEQRELGAHFHTYEQGLLDVLRQAPDVVVVGELREREAMRLTLDAAESGHLVFATMHASTPEEAIYRICNSFPIDGQEFVRFQLASTLSAVIIQRLIYHKEAGFMVPHLAVMRGTSALRNMIRENKLSQIEGFMDTYAGEGMFTFDSYKERFLDTQKRFHPPAENFLASRSWSGKPDHTSPLIDYTVEFSGQRLPVAGEPAQLASTPQAPASAASQEDVGEYSNVDSSLDLDEYIRQLNERGGKQD